MRYYRDPEPERSVIDTILWALVGIALFGFVVHIMFLVTGGNNTKYQSELVGTCQTGVIRKVTKTVEGKIASEKYQLVGDRFAFDLSGPKCPPSL